MTQPAVRGNILVVDDTPDNLRLLSSLLTPAGYQVRKALNGQTALNSVRSRAPDLILLDIHLPDLDGYELCRRLKEDENTREIPVIFLSAFNEVSDKVKAFQVGGVDYISKPFQGEEAIARIENQFTIARQKKQLQDEIDRRRTAEETLEFYLHAVSHDLRNPVIGMSLILNHLRKKAPGESIEISPSVLQQMLDSCDRQLTLIDSLVETRQNDLWGISLQCNPLSLPELVEKIDREWALRLEEHQAKLITKVPEDLPPVNADSHHLWRVFENLLANALKHNPSGVTITLSAEIQGDFVLCEIADDGIGIDGEQAKHLFDRYHRGTGKQAIGLGLGLYLCRQIITAHGGEIGAITGGEKGSRFWFTLPVAKPSFSE